MDANLTAKKIPSQCWIASPWWESYGANMWASLAHLRDESTGVTAGRVLCGQDFSAYGNAGEAQTRCPECLRLSSQDDVSVGVPKPDCGSVLHPCTRCDDPNCTGLRHEIPAGPARPPYFAKGLRCCPKCSNESMLVLVTYTAKAGGEEWRAVYVEAGYGACPCGFQDFVEDASE